MSVYCNNRFFKAWFIHAWQKILLLLVLFLAHITNESLSHKYFNQQCMHKKSSQINNVIYYPILKSEHLIFSLHFLCFFVYEYFSSHYRKCEAHLSINDIAFNHSRPYLILMLHISYFVCGYNLGWIYRFGFHCHEMLRWIKLHRTVYTRMHRSKKWGFPNFISILNELYFFRC